MYAHFTAKRKISQHKTMFSWTNEHPGSKLLKNDERMRGKEMSFEVSAEFVKKLIPKRNPEGHKGMFGKVHVIGGSIGYTGAPVLAAKAAQRTGSGLVSLSVPKAIMRFQLLNATRLCHLRSPVMRKEN